MSLGSAGAYMPRSSGLLRGAGRKRFRRTRQDGGAFPDLRLSETKRIREEIPEFDPDRDYTNRELILLAERILLTDPKSPHEEPMILTTPMYLHRLKPEIYTGNGIPDPAINEGLYWRTHPQGRKWATPEMMRTTGCAFYDGVQETECEIVPPASPRPAARATEECSFPGCSRPKASKGLCQAHYVQQHKGEPLRHLRPMIRGRKRMEEIRRTWDSGETDAQVAERYGVSSGYVGKLRREGYREALMKNFQSLA